MIEEATHKRYWPDDQRMDYIQRIAARPFDERWTDPMRLVDALDVIHKLACADPSFLNANMEKIRHLASPAPEQPVEHGE